MIKTVILTGTELKTENLGGFNTVVHNLSSETIYASKYPNISAGADNVAEIPAGSAKLISTTNGTVYLLGTGKAELTGQDHDNVNFRQPSSSNGGDGMGGDLKQYVDEHDSANLEKAKSYVEMAASSLETEIAANAGNILTVGSELAAAKDQIGEISDSITSLKDTKADRSELPTTLPANGGNADTVNGHTVNADVPEDAKFTDTKYTHPTTAGNKHIPSGGKSGQILRWSADGTAVWGADNNTTYSAMTGATASAAGKTGLVPAPAKGGQNMFLRGNATWDYPLKATDEAAGQDLNDFRTAGMYYFRAANTPKNIPAGLSNGWLIVQTAFDQSSTGAVKQLWFRQGTIGSNDHNAYVRTFLDGTWSPWVQYLTTKDYYVICSIVQGTLSGVTTNQGISYIPYLSGASRALVEVWTTNTKPDMVFSASSYGSRYLTGLSNSMTAIAGTNVFNGPSASATIGAASDGRIMVGGSVIGSSSCYYRVTWFI